MNWPALILATLSFAISFAAWGLVGGLAPIFTDLYHLTAFRDRASRRRARAARLAGAAADGHADRSLRRPRDVHGAARGVRRRGVGRAADHELRDRCSRRRSSSASPVRRLRSASRSCRGGRRRRGRARRSAFSVSASSASRLAVFGGAVAAAAFGWQSGVSRRRRRAAGLGGRLRGVRAERADCGAAGRRRRDGARAAARADRVVAWRVLLPDLRRLRRVLDLPADAAARAVRAGAGRCRASAPRASSCSRH